MPDPLNTAEIESFDTWSSDGRYYPLARVDELFDLRARNGQTIRQSLFSIRMSYAVLSGETQHLAARLQSLGVQPGTLVGICMDRCAEMVAALLATFRAGAAYLPLDPCFSPGPPRFMQARRESPGRHYTIPSPRKMLLYRSTSFAST